MTNLDRQIAEGSRRLTEFVIEAASSTKEPRPDWRDAIHDAVQDLDRIQTSPLAHPDDVARAQMAIGALSHIWLSVEEAEAIYLGDRSLP